MDTQSGAITVTAVVDTNGQQQQDKEGLDMYIFLSHVVKIMSQRP